MTDEFVYRFYQRPGLNERKQNETLQQLQKLCNNVQNLETEYCFYVVTNSKLSEDDLSKIQYILKPTFDAQLSQGSQYLGTGTSFEIGPRLNFSTAFSTNAVSICTAIGLKVIERIERSTIYSIGTNEDVQLSDSQVQQLVCSLHDRMTEQLYPEPVSSFRCKQEPEPWVEVNVIERGAAALKEISDTMQLAFDENDVQYYTHLFKEVLKRNPTTVECFDLAQSNSEHSRHWFFKGRIDLDGKELKDSLIDMVCDTQNCSNGNNVIKFNDNSSAIVGYPVNAFKPLNAGTASSMCVHSAQKKHIIFTAETHNFPTAIAPFQGATTGTGGRIRDVQATGRGGYVIAGTAGYSTGSLNLKDYPIPGELCDAQYPPDFATPAQIAIDASNGASDYGNKFGEPVINGFFRSFGQLLPSGERSEYVKPIMFSGGIGTMADDDKVKLPPAAGDEVVKVGGPIYRIGVGGGAASSTLVQAGSDQCDLNFGAVQRGDAEMEQKMNRVIRACVEAAANPIESIHDQGAGGNGNVLKELAEPNGAVIYTKQFQLGDPSISTLELWGAEYQESNALIAKKGDPCDFIRKVAAREKVAASFVGEIVNNGRIQLIEGERPKANELNKATETGRRYPVDLELEYVLGSMPRKLFVMQRSPLPLKPLTLPPNFALDLALNQVLRIPSVASKRWLTNKVDRSVTGLIAQQQCVGYLHTPVSDFGAISLGYYDHCGAATAIGEQPVKGLLDPSAGGRLSVAEMMTNLMFIFVSSRGDIKCSGNWMWPAKLAGEGSKLVDTCIAMCDTMKSLRIAIDGGKDSLSMAASSRNAQGQMEVIKSPGTLVVSGYAPVPDFRKKVTPVLTATNCTLLHIDLSGKLRTVQPRLGGSAFAQCFAQIGNDVPDLDEVKILAKGFDLVQQWIQDGVVTAGHDVSDGGLLTTLLEMAFATNCGLNLNFDTGIARNCVASADEWQRHLFQHLFAEEVGIVVEVVNSSLDQVLIKLKQSGITAKVIGNAMDDNGSKQVTLTVNGETILSGDVAVLRDIWEETSYQLELRQADFQCVTQEKLDLLRHRKHAPNWSVTFDMQQLTSTINKVAGNLNTMPAQLKYFSAAPKVAVLREEGCNGDREMAAALFMAGFDVIDLTVSDLINDLSLNLDWIRGIVFPGGFSYGDVLGSARGWAATLRYNTRVAELLQKFKERTNTWSLGVCNGCQLLALNGWIGERQDGGQGVQLQHNESGRFESRFVNVKIMKSNSILLKEMENSVLGVWVAHGEGKFAFVDSALAEMQRTNQLIALSYVDDDAQPTTRYPMNPNGSVHGIAGLVSKDGRHLAMMPHPERCVQMWQMPWCPASWNSYKLSPWAKMFRNAYDWCSETQ